MHELEVIVPKSGSDRLELGWVKPPSSHTRYRVRALGREWQGEVRFEATPCETVELGASSAPPGAQRISITLERQLARLDFVRLRELLPSRP